MDQANQPINGKRSLYVISYLPPDPNIRALRQRHHGEQLFFFLDHGFEITVFAQGYSAGDYFNDDDVHYIVGPSDRILPPGAARNKLLDIFYKSKTQFAVFADDDAIIDDHCDGIDAICTPLDHPEKFADTALLAPLNPVRRGFNAMYKEDKARFIENWSLSRIDDLKGSLFVLKNTVFDGHTGYFFDPAYDHDGNGSFIGGEDGDLCMQLIRDGWGAYTLENCVLKELGGASASTWAPDTSDRSTQKARRMKLLEYKFSAHGFDANSSRKWSDFWKANCQLPTRRLVPKRKLNQSRFTQFA